MLPPRPQPPVDGDAGEEGGFRRGGLCRVLSWLEGGVCAEVCCWGGDGMEGDNGGEGGRRKGLFGKREGGICFKRYGVGGWRVLGGEAIEGWMAGKG